jgi:hypothetical protein
MKSRMEEIRILASMWKLTSPRSRTGVELYRISLIQGLNIFNKAEVHRRMLDDSKSGVMVFW